MTPSRLNILWICADDFTPYASGFYGHPFARTSNLDRLAKEGLIFERAYCNCPLSTPSRQSFWTGRYPWTIGVTISPSSLPEKEVTLPGLLRQVGYRTASFGKTNYYAPRKHEFHQCADHVEYQEWLEGRKRRPLPSEIEVLGPWRPFAQPAAQWLNSSCLPFGAWDEEMQDTYHTRQAVSFLHESSRSPFFLFLNFHSNHSPFRFPIEFRGRYRPEHFTVPPLEPEDAEQMPLVFANLTTRDKQGILAAYYTAVEYMDRNVGLVLDGLERSGRAADTLVLFTSDHGYLLGQHGRFEKHCCYEQGVRSALILRYPGLIEPGTRSEALVEFVDLVPTLLQMAGLKIPARVQGRSLLPLVRGGIVEHRNSVISCYAGNEEAMLRTTHWKLIYCTGRRWRWDGYATSRPLHAPSIRLYDMIHDPDETTNLSRDTQYAAIIDGLLTELARRMAETFPFQGEPPSLSDPQKILARCLIPVELSDRGRRKEIRRNIIRLIRLKWGEVPDELKALLSSITTIEPLAMMLDQVIAAESLEEIQWKLRTIAEQAG